RGGVECGEFSWTYSVVRSVVRMVAAAGPADRSTVIVTSRGLRSTLDLSSAAQPLRHTHTPLIATLIRSGPNAASVVPTAESTRPPFGAAPAVVGAGDGALEQGRPGYGAAGRDRVGLVRGTHHLDRDELARPLGVGLQLPGQVGTDRGERPGERPGVRALP